jgi:AraC-like DNA-binding protein
VLELLLLQLEQMGAHDCGEFCNLRRTDVDKIHAARDIILHNLGTPCTLIGLAQQVGTNEFTLKKGFRELFGTTVFGFWSEMKMARARQLLTEEGLSVGEVSDLIGYKNAQHFSTAFKRRYGLPPGELKK